MIPIPQQYSRDGDLVYFQSKDVSFVMTEIYRRIKEFDYSYITKSCGNESFIYLLFQRNMINLIFMMTIVSATESLLITTLNIVKDNRANWYKIIYNFFLNNKDLESDYSVILHILTCVIFTLLHYRFVNILKNESKLLYFERYINNSKNKDCEWLSARTLHISGIKPNERNSINIFITATIIKRKLDIFLNRNGGGKVIDITFIPDYPEMLELEIRKEEINDIRKLVNISDKDSFFKKLFLPKIYLSEVEIQNQLELIEHKLQEEIQHPVYSSGHAFVCFDSLLSAYICLNNYEESTFQKLKLKLQSLGKSIPKIKISSNQSTFGKFQDEDEGNILDYDQIEILFDQMLEPADIIWTNVGGDRGLYICRRILSNLMAILILLFLTTPTSFLSALKSVDYLSILELKWILNLPFGNFLIVYITPLLIILINQFLLMAIDMIAYSEKHYTHSRCQNSIFMKALFYLLLNTLIIPGVTMTTVEPLFKIIVDKNYNISEVLGSIYLSNSGYFFINVIIQNGTLSAIFFLLRIDDLVNNQFSPFFAYYKRYFQNFGKLWHRREKDIFQFGFFYAQMITIYSIVMIFSSTVPLVSFAGLFFFVCRYPVDFISLLTVHRLEMDSNGEQINTVLKYSNISIFFFHICMICLFIIKRKFSASIVMSIITILSIVYMCIFNQNPIFDIFTLNSQINKFENVNERIPIMEINKWRNKFKHPLVLPSINLISSEKGENYENVESMIRLNANSPMNKNN